MKKILSNSRVKSFLWRTGMMILAVIIGQVTEILPLLTAYTNPTTVTILGLVLGEVSKALNKKVTYPTTGTSI